MHARVTVYIYIHSYHHATWWLIDHDAHKASSYVVYGTSNTLYCIVMSISYE